MGSAPDGRNLISVQCACFSPDIDNPSCKEVGEKTCGKCRLVKYCSKECQTAHWPLHKVSCKSPLTKESWLPRYVAENRRPACLDRSVTWVNFGWGNHPAFDSLKLEANEGHDWDKDLDLCFVDSGDLRNAILSVNSIPSSFRGKCKVVISDYVGITCIRNTLILLIFASFPPEEAAEIAIHLWYSAALPSGASKPLRDVLLGKVYSMVSRDMRPHIMQVDFMDTIFTDNFKLGASAEMKAMLSWAEWFEMGIMLGGERQGTTNAEVRKEKVMDKNRADYRDKEMHSLKPYHRIARKKFYEDGLVLPFGAYHEHFTDPNFALHTLEGDGWIPSDDADPLLGWDLNSVLKSGKENSVTCNDLYGALYFHLRKEFVQFAKQLSTLNLQFTLISTKNFKQLPKILAKEAIVDSGFDRIDTTTITSGDLPDLGPALRLYGPLLKPLEINKHAALITLVSNYELKCNDLQLEEKTRVEADSMRVIAQKIYPDPEPLRKRDVSSDPYLSRLDEIKFFLLRDWEPMFKWYEKDAQLIALGKRGGVEKRAENRIVKRFPFKVDKNSSIPEMSKQIALMSLGRRWGNDCYLEWQQPRVAQAIKSQKGFEAL